MSGKCPSQWWTRTIEDCFLDQVRKRPDATAVVDRFERLTYRGLLDEAMAVACGLRCSGVERETLVGMAYQRSARAIVAMLGIVLAGGAYLPVNPSYPRRRIERVLNDSGVRQMLCTAEYQAACAGIGGVELLDAKRIAIPGGGADDHVVPTIDGDRSPLAYVMYTSGSTGEPKGVMIEHAGVLRLVKDTDYIEFSADDRILHAAALEFDAATFEVWGALLNGAQLCVIDESVTLVPDRFAAALRDHRVSICWLTAPLFHQLADEDPEIFAPLRALITGGDVVSPDHVRRVQEHNPSLSIYNGYGPTENTTFTTVHRIRGEIVGAIPIGKPIPGTTVLVRDGELYVGGLGLARGYHNKPQLTEQRFTVIEGRRYYRTGDRVYQDADGVLHFRGRVDNQVKILGNLVELDEVTAAVQALPGVRGAFTRAVGDTGTDRALVSWVVGPGLTAEQVRSGITEVLPGFMVPRHVVMVDRFPLTSSGKVDWRALPAPARPRAADAALSASQQRMAQVWSDVLGVDLAVIGPHDSFFDLGGNSLKLGVLLGRIGCGPSLADLYAARTLAAMSDAVDGATAGSAVDGATAGGLAPFSAIALAKPSSLHPQQRAMYALWQADPASLAYNVPFRLDIRGPLDERRLRCALSEVVARHDALRMRFVLDAGNVRQQPVTGIEPEFETVNSPGVERVARFVRPFHPDEPVVPRALLVRTDAQRHEFHVDVPHVIFDGVSLRLLVEDLLDRYAGVESAAPQVSYAQAAQWYHDRLAAGDRLTAEDYWLKRFHHPRPPLALPTDRPRGRRRAVRGAVIRRELGPEWHNRIESAARQHGTTEFVVLLAAYHAALARLTGQRSITVGCPSSGRTHPAAEAVIGMFVSTICLAVDFAPDATLTDLVAEVDEAARMALTHQDYPFEKLVNRLDIAVEPGRNPLFDAFFALQNIDFYEFSRGGLAVSVELTNPGTTRFDLNLQIYRRPDRLLLALEYATELFELASADYVLNHYVAVLTDLLTDPDALVHPATGHSPALPCADFDF